MLQSMGSQTVRHDWVFYKDPAEHILKTDDARVAPLQLQYNNTLTLRVVYLFNERRSKANQAANKKD